MGVGDDHELVAAVAEAAQHEFGDHVSAVPFQTYYLDITHPHANKGNVVAHLSASTGSRASRWRRSSTCQMVGKPEQVRQRTVGNNRLKFAQGLLLGMKSSGDILTGLLSVLVRVYLV